MDLLSVLRVMVVRWYVALPVLLLTMTTAVVLHLDAPSEYEAVGSVLLTEPEIPPALVDLGEVIGTLQSEATASELASDSTQFVVQTNGETIEIVSVGPTAEASVATTRAVVDRLAADIIVSQDEEGVPEEERVRLSELTPIISAEPAEDGLFRADSEVVLEDPTSGLEGPYFADGTTGRVLEVAMMSDRGRSLVEERTGSDVDYLVSQEPADPAPILEIATYGPTPETSLAAFDQVLRVLEEDLDRRQARAGVASTQRIGVEVLAAPQTVTDASPLVARSTAAIVALGLFAAPTMAIAADAFARRRRGGGRSAADEQRTSRLPEDPWAGTAWTLDPSDLPNASPAGPNPTRREEGR